MVHNRGVCGYCGWVVHNGGQGEVLNMITQYYNQDDIKPFLSKRMKGKLGTMYLGATTYQHCPYTVVIMCGGNRPRGILEVVKCRIDKDEFNPETGIKIALGRAVMRMVRGNDGQ